MFSEWLIRWTARLAVGCYVARLVCDVKWPGNEAAQRTARRWWSIGCFWFTLHVISVFHFQHAWDHEAAWNYTAKRTAELTGWDTGIGLSINEAFLTLWLIDTLLWWRHLSWSKQRVPYWIVQAIFAFLMFQATVVFGPRFWIPIFVLVTTFLGGTSIMRRSSMTTSVL